MATFGDLVGGRLRRSVIDPETGRAVITSAPTGEVVQRSAVLPVGRDDAGRVVPALPSLITGALDAAALPGRVARGEVSIFDPQTGHVSDRAVEQAADLAGLAMTGSLPFSAPAGALRIFGGRSAKTADLGKRSQAEQMVAKGADRQAVWDETGWFRGADGQWRFEIPDDLATLGPAKNAPPGYDRLHHDDLADAYPALWGRTQQSIAPDAVKHGSFDRRYDTVTARGPNEADRRSVALHEFQHAVQKEEGFARGANLKAQEAAPDPDVMGAGLLAAFARQSGDSALLAKAERALEQAKFDRYQRHAGEVEARNVQARQDWTPEQRREIPPWVTQDVPDERQILPAIAAVAAGGGAAALAAPGEARAAETPRTGATMSEDPWSKFRKPSRAEAPTETDPWARFRKTEAPAAEEEPTLDPTIAAYTGEVLSGDPARARPAIMREQGRQAGAKASAAKAAAVGLQAGAAANFNDEIAGASRASGLPDWTPPAIAAPVGLARMGLDAAGITSGRATQDYADQREYARGYQEAAREANPVSGFVGEVVGGMALPVSRLKAGAGLVQGMKQGAVAGAGYGVLAGAGDGESAAGRAAKAATGGAIGGTLGAALPAVGAAVAPIVAPIVSNVAARVNPAGYAERQVARAAERSGQTADEIADRIAQAAAEGQGEFRALDALGYPGARLGAVVAKNPGEGRTQIRDFLNARQEGQAHRLGNAIEEGLGAPETANAATARMEAARKAQDDAAFGAVRADAEAVNVAPAIKAIDRTLRPGAAGQLGLQNGIAYDSVEGALSRARALLTDGRSQITDFDVVQRARGDIADAIEKAVRSGEGNKARLLREVRFELDKGLQTASPAFREAMERSRIAAREVEAVETGAKAAGRGRTEDKVATFADMSPAEQAAFRTGYADPVIASLQGGAEGANKARPFTSQARQEELRAFAAEGQGDKMMRRIDREGEMFANRAEALGNSKTAENLADNADTGIDAGLVAKLFTGNLTGAARDALSRGIASLNGNTEAVRNHMARLLMEGDPVKVRAMLIRLGAADLRREAFNARAQQRITRGAAPAVNAGPREPAGAPLPKQ